VATQFFFTLCFVGMLLAIAMVLMYLLCIDDYYRVKVLRWTGVDLLVSGASIISSRIPGSNFSTHSGSNANPSNKALRI
jgi:hypothetical protein